MSQLSPNQIGIEEQLDDLLATTTKLKDENMVTLRRMQSLEYRVRHYGTDDQKAEVHALVRWWLWLVGLVGSKPYG